jgi:hypothetical protein
MEVDMSVVGTQSVDSWRRSISVGSVMVGDEGGAP